MELHHDNTAEETPPSWQETDELMLDMIHRAAGPFTRNLFRGMLCRSGIDRKLKKYQRNGLIEPVGELSLKGQGRALIVWAPAGHRQRQNQIRHDVLETELIVTMQLPTRRGRYVDQDIDPDFEWVLPNAVIACEIDTGTMSYQQLMTERFPNYKEQVVVWVSCGLAGVKDTTRLESMRKRASVMSETAWFVTFEDVLEHKHNCVLINYDGEELTFVELCQQMNWPETNDETNGENLS